MERVKRSRFTISAGVCAVAVAAIAAGCGSSSKSGTASPTNATGSTGTSTGSAGTTGAATAGSCKSIPAGPIKIGNILPLSNNPYSQVAGPLNTEIGIDVSYFNAHDSICGHKVQLVNADDKGDPATSLSLARQFVSEGVKIMLNDSQGPDEDAIQPYLMQNKVLVVSIAGITKYLSPAQNPSYFSVNPSDVQYAQATANAIKQKGWNDVGILNDGTDFGNDITGYLQKDLQSDGLTVTKTVNYSPTAVDLTAPLQQLKSAGAQTVTPASASGITALVAGMKQLGFPAQNRQLGGLPGLLHPGQPPAERKPSTAAPGTCPTRTPQVRRPARPRRPKPYCRRQPPLSRAPPPLASSSPTYSCK